MSRLKSTITTLTIAMLMLQSCDASRFVTHNSISDNSYKSDSSYQRSDYFSKYISEKISIHDTIDAHGSRTIKVFDTSKSVLGDDGNWHSPLVMEVNEDFGLTYSHQEEADSSSMETTKSDTEANVKKESKSFEASSDIKDTRFKILN